MTTNDLVREINRALYAPPMWTTARDHARTLVSLLDEGHPPPTVPLNWDLVESAETDNHPTAARALVYLAMLAMDLPPDPPTSDA